MTHTTLSSEHLAAIAWADSDEPMPGDSDAAVVPNGTAQPLLPPDHPAHEAPPRR